MKSTEVELLISELRKEADAYFPVNPPVEMADLLRRAAGALSDLLPCLAMLRHVYGLVSDSDERLKIKSLLEQQEAGR